MRRAIALSTLMLAACGTGGTPEKAGDSKAGKAVEAAVQTASLTGLYESDGSQMCIIERATGDARFALVLRTPAGACSGAGQATRAGTQLRLDMSGDQSCEMIGTIEDRKLRLPPAVGAGCAYYCAASASLANASFIKTGGTAEDAMRARDLVGDPLCAGMGTP